MTAYNALNKNSTIRKKSCSYKQPLQKNGIQNKNKQKNTKKNNNNNNKIKNKTT